MLESDQVKLTKTEKDILALVNHKFLVSIECALIDKTKLYFIMELMRGGERTCILFIQKRESSMRKLLIVFGACCVALGLGHLYSNHYVYRDLKLEIILMNKNRYLKSTNFGLAK